MKLQPGELNTCLRQDLVAFVERCFYELNPTTNFLPNWHLEVMCAALEGCRRGEITRLIVNVPPRSLKSLSASVALPAFILGHDPSAQIICASYAQDLSNKLSLDCRTILSSPWYQRLFPQTKLSIQRQALPEFMTTRNGFRLATSVGGVLTGRGADFIIIDDPTKPEDALSETQRKSTNDWFSHTLYNRLNDKRKGCIILIMQRLHQDDLVGHVLNTEPWKVIKFPAIAEQDETHIVETLYGTRRFVRRRGEALHPERESLEILQRLREVQGQYNFAGQYQQEPAPLGGGMVKEKWFRRYDATELPPKFELIFQSWDTATKPTELSDYSSCITLGLKDKHLYLLNVYRKRVGYPELKRAVREQAEMFEAQTVLIEDKSSGTQLIQELVSEGMHAVKSCTPMTDKIMRMNAVTSTIENGFVHLPDKAPWLGEYLLEITTFPASKYNDQVDATSQALEWIRRYSSEDLGVVRYLQNEAKKLQASEQPPTIPESMECPKCKNIMSQRIPGGLRCAQCGEQWPPPEKQPRPYVPTRKDWLNGRKFGRY
jgi:predicted phage terminase large subunit-like protein